MNNNKNDYILSPEQMTTRLRWLVHKTRLALLTGLARDFETARQDPAHQPKMESYRPDIKKARLAEYCNYAQAFKDLAVRDFSIGDPRPFTIYAASWDGTFDHSGLTIRKETTEGPKTWLLDVTFRQFATGEPESPAAVLASTPDGKEVRDALLKDGFIELTPARASLYLAAFNDGTPPFSPEKNMAFFECPPLTDKTRSFTRAYVERGGSITPPKFATI